MANEKTQVEIDAAVDAAIKVNGNREITPPLHNAIEKMLSNSNLNKKDGGILQALAFYNSAFSLTDPLTLVYKSYVDDLITALNALTQGTNTLTEPLILQGDKIGFGGTPSGLAHFVLPNDPSPLSKTTWTDVDVVFGEEGATGKALGVSYTTGTSTINMNFLEPSVQWLNAQFNFGTIGFYSGGGVLGFYQNNLGKIGINTGSLASGSLLTIRGTDDSNDDYQLRTFDSSGNEIFTLRNDKVISTNGNPVYIRGDGTTVGDLRIAYDSGSGELQAQKWNGVTWDFNTLI